MITDTQTILGVLGIITMLGWRHTSSMEKRIRDDAATAHVTIGDNINLVRQDIRDLRGDMKDLNTRVGRIEGKIGLPSE